MAKLTALRTPSYGASDDARHTAATTTATVIAAHGRHYLALSDGVRLQCVTRGKKSDIAVGDRVHVQLTSANQGVIESIGARSTLLYRSDQYKSKLLAANVTQLFVVVATQPGFADDLISRGLVAAEAAGVRAHIVLNKVDVTASLVRARERLRLYAALGYPIHEVSATAAPRAAADALGPLLAGESTILIGQSGMGKSSLINLLVPGAEIAVREISTALDTGKHTTTFTRLYAAAGNASIIDSPGFQEFGLYQLTEGMLERAFREFSPYLGKCKYYNCHHMNEPECAIRAAVAEGGSVPARHAVYLQLRHESSQTLY
ncbi:MAG: ribosome small subunit-dependent GTPase A [Burkholderiaceae bacterium]